MRFFVLLLSGCLVTSVDGDPSQPDVGRRYECSHVDQCWTTDSVSDEARRCASSKFDAETEELALCREDCSCEVTCRPVTGGICLLD